MRIGKLKAYNPWINFDCANLHVASVVNGKILCLSPQAGTSTRTEGMPGVTPGPGTNTGYSERAIPPPANSTVADGTTMKCGKRRTVTETDTCPWICVEASIPSKLFLEVNPSLSKETCDQDLVIGLTYCVSPQYGWNQDAARTTTSTATVAIAAHQT